MAPILPWKGRGRRPSNRGDDMEILATFPAVRIEAASAPAVGGPVTRPVPPSPATVGRPARQIRHPRPAVGLPRWSVTMLAVIAAAVWLAVWRTERQGAGPSTPVHTAVAEPSPGGRLSR